MAADAFEVDIPAARTWVTAVFGEVPSI